MILLGSWDGRARARGLFPRAGLLDIHVGAVDLHFGAAVSRPGLLDEFNDGVAVDTGLEDLPLQVSIIGKQITRSYKVAWEKTGTGEFSGARFTFTMEEA